MISNLTIRKAGLADAQAIRKIFNQGIEDGLATLETREQSLEDINNWMIDRDPRYMILLAEDEKQDLTGYLSLNKFNFKSAYGGVADLSIYIERSHRGQGIGKLLLEKAAQEAKKEGFYKLILNVLSCNQGAFNFYKKMGYSQAGIYKKQGMLKGQWVDAIIMELHLEENI